MNYFSEAERRETLIAGAAAVILVALALAIALWPGSIEALTGIRRAERIAAPDELPQLSTVDATPFFQDRDLLEIRVAETTTLRQFLDRNRLNKPYQRKQIVEQFGSSNPSAEIAAGTVFKLRLTPIAQDVPGTAPRQQPQ